MIRVGVLAISGLLTAILYLLLAAWLIGFSVSIAAITIAGAVGAIAGLATSALLSS